METFKFTDLSGVERMLSNEEGVAFEVSHTGTEDKIIEWEEGGTKLYCFVTADVANEIAASGLRLMVEGEVSHTSSTTIRVSHEQVTRIVDTSHRHPLFPNHDQIRLSTDDEQATYLIDARKFVSLREAVDGSYSARFEGIGYLSIATNCGDALKSHLERQNAILDIMIGDDEAKPA